MPLRESQCRGFDHPHIPVTESARFPPRPSTCFPSPPKKLAPKLVLAWGLGRAFHRHLARVPLAAAACDPFPVPSTQPVLCHRWRLSSALCSCCGTLGGELVTASKCAHWVLFSLRKQKWGVLTDRFKSWRVLQFQDMLRQCGPWARALLGINLPPTPCFPPFSPVDGNSHRLCTKLSTLIFEHALPFLLALHVHRLSI